MEVCSINDWGCENTMRIKLWVICQLRPPTKHHTRVVKLPSFVDSNSEQNPHPFLGTPETLEDPDISYSERDGSVFEEKDHAPQASLSK